MPNLPPRRCSYPGCPANAAIGSRCAAHQAVKERERGTTTERGLGARHRKLREIVLREVPWCQIQTHCVFPTLATEVDHIIPRSVRPDLTYERSNMQSACKACNSAKRDRENGSKVSENRAFPVGPGGFGEGLQTSAIARAAA